jgi:hypothetical protein
MLRKIGYFVIMCAALFLLAPSAHAGPPFLSDDPEPVPYQRTENDFFTSATHTKDGTAGTVMGLDANYGVWPDVELTLIAPLAFNAPDGSNAFFGYGDTQFAIKYRFLDESDDGWWPQIAIYPTVSVPTGKASHGLGAGNTQEFFPVWVQKDFDPWQTFGGGGYWNNPGAGHQNYWFFGWVLQRKITEELALGGEIFHQTASLEGEKDTGGFNLGGTYDLDENYHILFTAGRGIQNTSDTNTFSYYLALQLTY